MKIIPDTAIWSYVFRREKPNLLIQNLLSKFIDEGKVWLPGIIKQEVLSGIKNDIQFKKLSINLNHFPELKATNEDHILAANFFNKCQKSGIQGSHIDFLILAIAKNNSASILTTDKDFKNYKKIIQFDLQLIEV